MVRPYGPSRTNLFYFKGCITGLFDGYYSKFKKELQYAEGTNQTGFTECQGA